MFFALSNAMLDASIAAWDAKREYDLVRPVTAIPFFVSRGEDSSMWRAGQGCRGDGWGAMDSEPERHISYASVPGIRFRGECVWSGRGGDFEIVDGVQHDYVFQHLGTVNLKQGRRSKRPLRHLLFAPA
jgi:hypothetical protein